MSDAHDNPSNQDEISVGTYAKVECPYGHKGSTFYLHGWRCGQCGVRIIAVPGRPMD